MQESNPDKATGSPPGEKLGGESLPPNVRPGRLAFCIANNHHMMPDSFFWSYLRMLKPEGSFAVKGSASVKASSINEGIYQAVMLGAEWYFLMDVDMLFPPHAIPKLLQTAKEKNAKVVSVLYHMGRAPFGPVAGWTKQTEDGPVYVNSKGDMWRETYASLGKGIVEVDWVGAGGLLIHRDVLNAIKWPPFRDIWVENRGTRVSGHDVVFCERARAQGYKVYVDTDVKAEHGKFHYISESYAEAFEQSQFLEKMAGVIHDQTLEMPYWDAIWMDHRCKESNRDVFNIQTWKSICDEVQQGEKVVDLGSGPGDLLKYLKEHKQCTGVGIDFSPEAVSAVQQKGFEGCCMDLRSPSVNGYGGQFDTVIAAHVIEHLRDDKKLVEIAHAMCKPGGKVVLATPWLEKIQAHIEHTRGYNEDDLNQLLSPLFGNNVKIYKNSRDYIAVAVKQ